jgi:hypothetical protein
MEIKRSDIKLDKFTMLACSFATIDAEKKISSEKLKNIPVDLDYNILTNKKNSSKIRIMLELNSNQVEKPLPGYMYSVICASDHTIKGLNNLSQKEQNKHVLFTALPLAIAMVRSHLYNVSSNFPHGHYMLPSIDLMDLFAKKYGEK